MRSILNLNTINKSLTGLSESVKGAAKRSEAISDNIADRNKIKGESISMSSKLFARRRDNLKRKEKEDLIEAGGVMGALRAGGKIIQRNTKGFLGRILDFIGTVIIGWAIVNLPKIINVAENLIKRMKKYFDALNGFTTGVVTFFTDLGSKLKDVAGLIIQFDFEPMLKNVKTFMKKVQDAFTKITINTIRTVRNFLGMSERDLAKELGILDLYDQIDNPSSASSTQETGTSDDEDDDEENDEQTFIDLLMRQGLELLKSQQNGTLTREQRRDLRNKNYDDLLENLRTKDIMLIQNVNTGEYEFIPYATFKGKEKKFAEIGIFPVGPAFEGTTNPFDIEPSFASPITQEDIDREFGPTQDPMFTSTGRDMDFELPFSRDTTIVVPVDVPSGNSMPFKKDGSDIPSDTTDINTSNLKYKELFLNSLN